MNTARIAALGALGLVVAFALVAAIVVLVPSDPQMGDGNIALLLAAGLVAQGVPIGGLVNLAWRVSSTRGRALLGIGGGVLLLGAAVALPWTGPIMVASVPPSTWLARRMPVVWLTVAALALIGGAAAFALAVVLFSSR